MKAFRTILTFALFVSFARLSFAQGLISDLTVQRTLFLGSGVTAGKEGTISPTQLVANTNNWAPTGFEYALAIRFSTDASRNLTGIAGGALGRTITLENIGSFNLVLKNADTGSTAANRFALNADYTIEPGTGVMLKYDGTSSRWRIVGSQGTGGGGGGGGAENEIEEGETVLPPTQDAVFQALAAKQDLDSDLTYLAGFTPAANVKSVLNAADYAAIKTLLALVIGTNVQAYDADLDYLATFTPTANVKSILNAADYAAIKTLLALTIGTNVQAYDADLDYLATFTPTANVKSVLNAADYAAIKTLLSLVIGTNVQAYDADLDYLATFTPTANVKSILNAADYAAIRTLLGVLAASSGTATDLTLAGATAITGTVNYTVNAITMTSNAGVVDVTKGLNSSTNSAAATLTFSTDSVTATRFITVILINGDGSNARTWTFDTVTDFAVTVPAGTSSVVVVKSQGASGWALHSGGGNGLDLSSNTTPAVTRYIETFDPTSGVYQRSTVLQLLSARIPVELVVALSDETTAITTGTAKVTMRAPYAFTVTGVRASLNTVSSSGTPTVDINEGTGGGTTILSTKLTIDASELTSTTAAAAAVVSDTAIADDAEITFDIDTAGTGAKGLKVIIYGYR